MSVRVPIIAIVGKPNVGKSTLFNRIVGEKRAVVEDFPGVTRDRNYAYVESYEFPFHLVDTGGLDINSDVELADEVLEQVKVAIEEADVILALFDGNSPVQENDEQLMKILRASDKPIIYAVNKCDGKEQVGKVAEYYSLGIAELHDLSALHGHGVLTLLGELMTSLPNYESLVESAKAREAKIEAELEQLDSDPKNRIQIEEEQEILPAPGPYKPEKAEQIMLTGEEEEIEPEFAPVFFPDDEKEEVELIKDLGRKTAVLNSDESSLDNVEYLNEEEEAVASPPENIRVCLVGRPNVGKSTLLNTLLGEKRAVTSPISGTTRDSLDAEITRDGQKFTIVDTAGLRKKARITETIERYATLRALNAISQADVAVLLIDAEDGVTEQDARIAGLAHDQGKGLVIAVNKWDLVKKDHKTVKNYTDKVRLALKFAPYAPIVFVSAINGRRCPKIIETVYEVARARRLRVPTKKLNQIIERAVKNKTLPIYRGRPVKLYYATQVDVEPPRFVLFMNFPKGMHFSHLRYLKNSLRKQFEFLGTDIKLVCRKKAGSRKAA